MRTLFVCLVLVLFGIVSGCAPPTVPANVAPPASDAAAELGTIGVAHSGSLNAKNISLMATIEALRAQGYTVEFTTFARYDLPVAALEQGEVDFAPITASRAWAAVAQGADFCTVVGEYNSTFEVVVSSSIQACEDFQGKSLAFPSRQAVGYIMFEKYLRDNCPEVKPDIVLIAGSENRVAGLLSDEMDGAYLELVEWLQLDAQRPGDYHIFDYLSAYPTLLTGGIVVRCDWAEEHPDTVRDFIRVMVTAQRELTADPKRLQAELMELLEVDAATAQTTADTYLARKIWDLNGTITPENIQYTLDTLAEAEALPAGMQVEDVADLSYLEAVLEEIGRR